MQIDQIVALLIQERNRLDAAIAALGGQMKRRGRPPGSARRAASSASPVKKRIMSAAGRKAIATAARKRWAAIKAGKAPSPFSANKRGS